ncbi:MAG TPA: 4a-hydroxytetrahydrobiopterin dehydratase [Candidatus Baltobacteraceae bacterium]|nr:4a-hydroxytetrahydrobiopterin dehydratase [Candidatus Baltobacteraceae bacterium]
MDVPPGWTGDDKALTKTFDRGDFGRAIAFVNEVAAVANSLDHHPDLAISWGRVTIRTWSHDAGGITQRDVALAEAIDALA